MAAREAAAAAFAVLTASLGVGAAGWVAREVGAFVLAAATGAGYALTFAGGAAGVGVI